MKIGKTGDSIERSFMEQFSSRAPGDNNHLIGKPIFTKESIAKSKNELDRLLRTLFVEQNITHEYFGERFRDYARMTPDIHPGQIHNRKGNLLKAIFKGNISLKKFLEAVQKVLGYHVLNIGMEFTTPQGKRIAVDLRDTY